MTNSIPLSDLESSPSAKFEQLGDKHRGRIVGLDERQQTDISNQPLTFKDGSPRMMHVISIEKANGDVVNLFAKGGNFTAATGEGASMRTAIGLAVRAAGASSLDMGGDLAVAHTGLSEAKPGQSPAKLYRSEYKPPAASIPADDLFSS